MTFEIENSIVFQLKELVYFQAMVFVKQSHTHRAL